MGESKPRDPLVEEPRGWIALGATGCHSLREGMCCEERSSCDSQRAPSAKKVCDSQTHTDTTEHNTHCHSHSDTHKRSAAERLCHSECLSVVRSRVSERSHHLPDHPPWAHTVQSRGDVLRGTQIDVT